MVLAMLLGSLLRVTASQAATIVAYDGSNSPTSAAATQWLGGVTPLDLSRGAGLNAGSGATFNSTGWTDEATDFLEWGWSTSQPFDLTSLDLRYDRSASGPSGVDIQLSVNGGAFTSVFTDPSVDEAGEDVVNISLTAYTGVTSATFRLFGSGASSGTGTFDIEPLTGVSPAAGIMVSGTALPVPEPSSQALALLAGLGLLFVRRRR
jgi:MYXO-CTERM domain-containing protein